MNKYPASQLHWNSIDNFSASEFKRVDLTKLDECVILNAQSFREALGERVHPSPAKGAFVRTEGSSESRHYAVGRLCDAGDWFAEGHIADSFLAAVSEGYGGIGIYVDTEFRDEPWPMIHLDNRNQKLFWICEKVDGEDVYTYVYPHKNPGVLRDFLKKLSEVKICH